MASKIPEKHHGEILDMLSSGKSTREIAEHLECEHGIKVHFTNVARLCRKFRKERTEISKAVLRETIGSNLTRDLLRLENLSKNLLRRLKKCTDDSVAIRLIEELRRLVETKLKYSGADEKDDKQPTPVIMIPPESDE